MEGISESTFLRRVYLDSTGQELRIHQCYEGDVGCVVWDGALVLGKYIDHRNNTGKWSTEQVIVELGAGTGIVGLITASFGNTVILTDLAQFVPLMEKNIRENEHSLKGKVEARTLEWGTIPEGYGTPDCLLLSECVYYQKVRKKQDGNYAPSQKFCAVLRKVRRCVKAIHTCQ